MKRLYITLIALASMCYMYAQDRIYVHRSNGNIEAISLDQLDSLSFVSTKADLQLSAEKDTLRVGEYVYLTTNIIPGSTMLLSWGTRDGELITVGGNYDRGHAYGLHPGLAEVQVRHMGQLATYPLTVIGQATSTGTPKTTWTVSSSSAQAGAQIPFVAEYDSKDSPVDYTAVWYEIVETEDKVATCALINFTYAAEQTSRTILPMAEQQRYTHSANSWSDDTQSYVCSNHFTAALHDTLCPIAWRNPRDTNGFAQNVKTYFGENFLSDFKAAVKAQMDAPEGRDYSAYHRVMLNLNLISYDDWQWMTDSIFNANSHAWECVFKQNDTIWSTTHFDTLGMRIDTSIKVTGRPPYRDTTYYYDTVLILQPWVEQVRYVYPEIQARLDRIWRDSVSYLDLLVGAEGYGLDYQKKYMVNAEFRVYDKKGNSDRTNTHSVELANTPEKVIVKAASEPIIVRETPVTLQVGSYYTMRQGTKQYRWTLPEGTINAATGEKITSFEGETTPALLFGHVGGQLVECQVTINGVSLPKVNVQVPVGYTKKLPTLYYATAQGNIQALKIMNAYELPADIINQPYDLGFRTEHAFNIFFHDSLLYVLEAGKQFYYVNDINGTLGDGKISVLSKDGSRVETMISNVGRAAFDDPFYGYIQGDYLYYANRSTGIIKVHLGDRNRWYSEYQYPYFVRHNRLHYYGVGGLMYGAISRNFAKIDDVWHWSTCHTSTATFCFRDEDILREPIGVGDSDLIPEEGKICDGMKIGSFYYSKKHDKVVFSVMDYMGNCVAACSYDEWKAIRSSGDLRQHAIMLDGMNFASNLDSNIPDVEGTGVESVGITQMAYDEVNECVYFAYRNNGINTNSYPPTGIYRYNLVTGAVECVVAGVEAYGVTVNNQPSQAF